MERLDDRRVFAAITGIVFEDMNQSFFRDSGEPAAASRLIFLDTNANATLDVGEPLTVAGGDGAFSFQGLADGSYEVRVFDGTTTQQQTFPFIADTPLTPIAIAGGVSLFPTAGTNGGRVLTADSIVTADLTAATSSTLSIGNPLTGMQSIPGDRFLAIGEAGVSSDTAWIIDGDVAAPVDLSVSGATDGNGTADRNVGLAIGSGGLGLLLVTTADPASLAVRTVDASDVSGSILVTDTGQTVAADSRVIASSTGVRSVLASPSPTGLLVSMWSNSDGVAIGSEIAIAGVTEMLAFDDAAGILVLRTADGGVSVHDVDDSFRQLDAIGGSISAVMIDPSRDLLIAYDDDAAALRVIHLADASQVATLPVDLSAIGSVVAIAEGDQPDSFLILGTAGLHEIKLNRPDAHRVTIVGGEDANPISFGVLVIGPNTSPYYEEMPTLEIDEDEALTLPAGSTTFGSLDLEGSNYVLVQQSDAANGTATLNIDGSIEYVPNDDFNGTDVITVVLHDGQNVSEPITLSIDVRAVPDSPTGVVVTPLPLPENAPVGAPAGVIDIIDVDGGGHIVTIDDPRFGPVVNGNGGIGIILLGGPLDFESEPFISLGVSVTDPDTSDVFNRNVSLRITDANDPITGILPTEAFVFENSPGDLITALIVVDQDAEQSYTFTVDDARFIVDGYDLRLADGVALDYETEDTITINVTATEVGAGGTFTQAITISVRDVGDTQSGMSLTDRVVIELTPGDEAGEVLIDGAAPSHGTS